MEIFNCRGTIKFYDSIKNYFGFVQIKDCGENSIIGKDAYLGKECFDSAYDPNDEDEVYFTVTESVKGFKVEKIYRRDQITNDKFEEFRELLLEKDLIFYFQKFLKDSSVDIVSNHYELIRQVVEIIPLTETYIDEIEFILGLRNKDFTQKVIEKFEKAVFSLKLKILSIESNPVFKVLLLKEWITIHPKNKKSYFKKIVDYKQNWLIEETNWLNDLKVLNSSEALALYLSLNDVPQLNEHIKQNNEVKSLVKEKWNEDAVTNKLENLDKLSQSDCYWLAEDTDWIAELNNKKLQLNVANFQKLLKHKQLTVLSFNELDVTNEFLIDLTNSVSIKNEHPEIIQLILNRWLSDPESYLFKDSKYIMQRLKDFIKVCNSKKLLDQFLIEFTSRIDGLTENETRELLHIQDNGLINVTDSFKRSSLVSHFLHFASSQPFEKSINFKYVYIYLGQWNSYIDLLPEVHQLQLYLNHEIKHDDIDKLKIRIDDPLSLSKYIYDLDHSGQCHLFSLISYKLIQQKKLEELSAYFDSLLNFINSNRQKLSASLIFVCYLIRNINKNSTTERILLGNDSKSVFEFIYKKLISEELITNKLDNFFEPCDGRIGYQKAIINQPNYNNGDREPIDGLTLDESNLDRKTKACQFCEGRIKETNQKDMVFWCRNSWCAKASRVNYLTSKQSRYIKLSYILNAYGYNFEEVNNITGLINGWINKINGFLEHLICRGCTKPLYPNDKGSGYYRCNYFSCRNTNCSMHNETVYLTHCINPRCFEYIDSRDTKKCSHGWYICNNCYACCTTEKIQNRISYYENIGKIYNGPTQGHKDLNVICCPGCGNAFNSRSETYLKMLNRLSILAQKKDARIKKSGQKNNHSWFIIRKLASETVEKFNSGINKLEELGFTIGNDYSVGKEEAFVAEKWNNGLVYNCETDNCNHKLSLFELEENHHYDQLKAIRKFYTFLPNSISKR